MSGGWDGDAGFANAVALMEPEASDHQLAKIRELDNPSGRFRVVVAHLDQAAGEARPCKLVSIGYVHLVVAAMHEALSAMSIEELEPLFS